MKAAISWISKTLRTATGDSAPSLACFAAARHLTAIFQEKFVAADSPISFFLEGLGQAAPKRSDCGRGRMSVRPRPNLTREQISEIREAFGLFDKGRGRLNESEVVVAIRSLGLVPPALGFVGPRIVSFEEFADIVAEGIQAQPEEDFASIAQSFDLSATQGRMSFHQFRRWVNNFGQMSTDEEINEFWATVDVDRDGWVTSADVVRSFRAAI